MKKSFILHLDSLEILEEMTLEQKGILFDAIHKFQKGEEVNLDFAMKMAFAPFKNQFIRDNEKYNEFKDKQVENGKKGGRPPKPKPNNDKPENPSLLEETQKSPNVSVNDSVSENANENETVVELPEPKNEIPEVPEFVRQQQQEFKEQLEKSTIPKVSKDETLRILKTDLDLINQVLREFRKNDIDTDYFCLTKNDIYKPTEDFKKWYEWLVEDCVIKADNKQEYPKKLGDTKIHVINFLRYQDFQKLKAKLMPKVVRQPVYEEEYD